MDGRIPDGLRVACDESSRVISLLQIRNRRRDGIVLLRGLILGDRCVILVGADDRMATGERQRIDRERLRTHRITRIPARIDAAHLPRHGRRRVIGTEKKRCRRIRPQLVPWFLLVRRFRLFVRRIKVKVLCRLACLVFFGKCFFQLREKTPKASQNRICRRLERRIPADARCRHRIRRIDAAVFRERILRLHRHIALRVDRARHIRCRFRIRDPETDREPQRLSAVRRARAQRADRFRADIHISLACQRRLLSYLRRDVARKLRPGKIQRHTPQRHNTEIHQAHLDRIRAFRGERRILRGRDRAVIHIDIRLHVADAHVKPDADQIHIERRDIRLCVRRDLHIAMPIGARAIAERRDVRLVDVHIRLGIRLRRRAERAEIAAVLFDKSQDGIVIFFPLDARLDLRICKCIVIADDARRRGAGGNVYIIPLDRISAAALLSHLHQRIRAVADVPCIELRRRCRMDRYIPRLMAALSFGRDRRIIHIDARDAHDIPDRRDIDLAAVLLLRRRVDVRILYGNHAIARLLTGIRLQLRITRRRRQRDRPAAGRDAARLCFRAFDCEIIPRLYGDTPPMRHGLARQRDILLRDQCDAVRRLYRRRRIHDARRIYERISICIRTLTRSIGFERRTRLDERTAFCLYITLCRCDDHTVLCVDFARERNPGIARRVAAPQRAVIQKTRPLCWRFPIEFLITVKVIRNLSPLRRLITVTIIKCLSCLGIRPQRQPSHIEDAMRADRNACIREEIHVAADLIILDRIHHAVDVDLILDDIDLVIRLFHMEIRHIVLRDAEIIEVVQRIAILHLLVRDVILLAAVCDILHGNRISIVLLIRHCHIRIDEIASRAPARDGKEQRRPCAGEDAPAAAHALLPPVRLHQLRSDHIAATRGIPDDFVYFIHKRVLLCVERSSRSVEGFRVQGSGFGVVVAASPRICMGRCPKVSWKTGFPIEFSKHRPLDRE